MISTAGDETWLVLAIGCPSSYGSSCAEDRGKQFSIGNSTSWTNIQQFYTLSLETNLGYTGTFGTVAQAERYRRKNMRLREWGNLGKE